MDKDRIERIARDLLEHRTADREMPVGIPREAPSDRAEAYAVQDAIERLLAAETGARPIGYKIGATNATARETLKVEAPFRGRLYDTMTSPSGARVARRPNLYRVWEVEIALRIGRTLDPADAPFDAAAIEAATGAVLPAIEIVGSVFEPWLKAGAANIMSDLAVHGHWVHGAPVTDWSGIDLLESPVTLSLDGTLAATGKGSNVDGGPFGATAVLANELAREGRALAAGDYVTTGTVTPLVPIGAHTGITADFGPLGQVSLTMA